MTLNSFLLSCNAKPCTLHWSGLRTRSKSLDWYKTKLESEVFYVRKYWVYDSAIWWRNILKPWNIHKIDKKYLLHINKISRKYFKSWVSIYQSKSTRWTFRNYWYDLNLLSFLLFFLIEFDNWDLIFEYTDCKKATVIWLPHFQLSGC